MTEIQEETIKKRYPEFIPCNNITEIVLTLKVF